MVVAAEVLFTLKAPAASAAKKVVALRVDRVWKGSPPPEIRLLVGSSDCDYGELDRGDAYLLFAERLPGPAGYLVTSRCLPNRRLSEAGAELAALGPGRPVLHPKGGARAAVRVLLMIAAGLVSLVLGIYVFYLRTR